MPSLRRSLDLRVVRNTSLIEIQVYSNDPKEASDIANAVANSYKLHRLENWRGRTEEGIKTIESRLKEQEEQVRKAQKKVDDLRVELNVPDSHAIADAPSMLMSAETLRKIEGLRIEGQAMMVREETLLTRLRSLNPEELAQVLPTASPDSLLSSLLEQLTMAEQKLVSLKKESGPDHTEVQKVSGQVEDLQTKIKHRVNGIVGGLETRVEAMRKSQEVLEAEVKKAQQADQNSASNSRPYFEAKRELEEKMRFRQLLTARIIGEKTDLSLPKESIVEIVDRAEPVFKAVRPNKPLNIGVGILVGGVSGLFLATFIYVLNLRAFRLRSGAPKAQFSPGFRKLVHILIALVVGLYLGYMCAEPLNFGFLIAVPVLMLLGALASAYIELAKPSTSTSVPNTPP